MSIKDSIASLRIGDCFAVSDFCTANYVQALAKRNNLKLIRRKLVDGFWEFERIGAKRYYARIRSRRSQR